MPVKKGSLVSLYVSHEFASQTGLLESENFCHPVPEYESDMVVLGGYFIEYDDMGGIWLKALYRDRWHEVMIPREVVNFMVLTPSKAAQKKMGFDPPLENEIPNNT